MSKRARVQRGEALPSRARGVSNLRAHFSLQPEETLPANKINNKEACTSNDEASNSGPYSPLFIVAYQDESENDSQDKSSSFSYSKEQCITDLHNLSFESDDLQASSCSTSDETSDLSTTDSSIFCSSDGELSPRFVKSIQTAQSGTALQAITSPTSLETLEVPAILDAPTESTASFRNASFHVATSHMAGWGAFAERDLRNGEVILRERPMLAADAETLFEKFGRLSEVNRQVLMELHANDKLKMGIPRIKAVWLTNCFAMGPSVAGLFPVAARFNHACHPSHNIDYEYDEELDCLVLSVRADCISAGEELFISYRRKRSPETLYQHYGFVCRCGVCGGLSEERIRKMDELDEEW